MQPVVASPAMVAVLSAAKRAAVTEAGVLITGESGVGKEVLARYIHDASARSARQFVPFNCATVPKDMIDSQLFGYRRGAFTGAVDSFPGIIRGAESGTLFLDEVGELPLDIQPKLLRFLDAQEIHALGEIQPRRVDVRVIAATNRSLEQLAAKGQFRGDLYYRLNIIGLHIPPLRERREDIPPLVEHFLAQAQRRLHRSRIRLSPATLARLTWCEWPGNVRQLSSEVFRLVAGADSGQVVGPEALSVEVTTASADCRADAAAGQEHLQALDIDQPLRQLVDEVERASVENALRATGGSKTLAAKRLGISRKGLYLKRVRLRI